MRSLMPWELPLSNAKCISRVELQFPQPITDSRHYLLIHGDDGCLYINNRAAGWPLCAEFSIVFFLFIGMDVGTIYSITSPLSSKFISCSSLQATPDTAIFTSSGLLNRILYTYFIPGSIELIGIEIV